MSAVTFVAGRKSAVLRGSERAYARHIVYAEAIALVQDLATSAAEDYAATARDHFVNPPDWIVKAWDEYQSKPVIPGSAIHLERQLELWLPNADSAIVEVGGERLGFSELALNTALVGGSPAKRLLAYLHGSCEDHAYFEPPHDNLIQAIKTGRQHNLLRPAAGWEDVLDLAKKTKATIVTEYSVSDGYGGKLKALREAAWPINFGPHLIAENPQGYLTGASVYDLLVEVYR